MAPKKSFRTYGRQNNSSISCVEAFDILFAKNLTQRKLCAKNRIGKNKIKFEIKELATKVKTVLNDESSLHINVNDTFDKLLKKSPKVIKCNGVGTTVNKSVSVIKCLNSFSHVSPMLQKLRSYNSDKSSTRNAIDSWFNQPTPPGEQITNTLEIEEVKKKERKSKKASKFQSGRDSPILLRSRSRKININSSVESENFSKQKEMTEYNKSTTVATTKSCLFTDSVREQILMHCSTPVTETKGQRLVGQAISPIRNQDQVNNCIVESLKEIRSWNLSLPKLDDVKNDTEHKSHAEPPTRSLSFNLEDFESFFEELRNKSQAVEYKVDDFEQFHKEVVSCQLKKGEVVKNISLEEFESFYQSYQNKMSANIKSFFDSCRRSFNFVTHRKHRFLTPKNGLTEKQVHIMKDLVVVLDNNLMNYSTAQLIKQDKAHCALINANHNNKQLTVKLTRLSLDKLKLSLNQSRNLFKAKKIKCNSKFNACRKFSSNSLKTPMLLPNNSVTIPIRGGVNSGLADNSNISLGYIFDTRSWLSCNSFQNGSDNNCKSVTGNEESLRNCSRWSDENGRPEIFITNSPKRKTYNGSNEKYSTSMRMSVLKKSQTEKSVVNESPFNIEKPYVAKILVVSTNDNTHIENLEALDTSVEPKETPLSGRCTLPTINLKRITPSLHFSYQPSLKGQETDATNQYFAQDLSTSIIVDSPSPTIDTPRRSSPKDAENPPDCSIVNHSIFKIPKAKQELHLKAGKSWRRSLMQHKRESVIDLTQSRLQKSINPLRLTDNIRHSPKIVPYEDAKLLRRRTALQSYVYSGKINDTCGDNVGFTPQRLTREAPLPLITARDIVLNYCKQSEPVPFEKAYPKSLLKGCKKIGEGVYGEVFLYPQSDGSTTVMKVIPIEGDKIVNGERQKKFHEILSEVAIVSQLSNLRNNINNRTSSFCEVQRISCVKGKYPEILLNVWYDYDDSKGSENDPPDLFDDNQLYIVLDLANAGQDLEAFVFNNASQAFAMFNQVALALAVAEEHLKFEHRDLHWGNILLRAVDKKGKIVFKYKGKIKECPSTGVEATIIDFTFSRMVHDGVVIFNDLGQDPDLFLAEGDYQFDVYRLMKERNNNDWQKFTPYSNILWLHYVIKKSITALRYKNSKTQIHRKYIKSFKKYERDILRFNSVCEFVDECL